jgi:hypothetical protein
VTRKSDRLLHFEHHKQPLLQTAAYRRRVLQHALIGFGLIAVSLAIGVIGYHLTGRFGWLDSLYNASMILGGMGPVIGDINDTPKALKWFASFYALYSGLALLTSAGVLMAPIVHRILHSFHIDEAGGAD